MKFNSKEEEYKIMSNVANFRSFRLWLGFVFVICMGCGYNLGIRLASAIAFFLWFTDGCIYIKTVRKYKITGKDYENFRLNNLMVKEEDK